MPFKLRFRFKIHGYWFAKACRKQAGLPFKHHLPKQPNLQPEQARQDKVDHRLSVCYHPPLQI